MNRKAKALEAYLSYRPISKIAEVVGVTRQTIYNWATEGKWEEQRGQQEREALEVIKRENLDLRLDAAPILGKGLIYLANQLLESRIRDARNTASAIHEVTKALSLILGKPTEIVEEQGDKEYSRLTMQNLIMAAQGDESVNLDIVKLNLLVVLSQLDSVDERNRERLIDAVNSLNYQEIGNIFQAIEGKNAR